MADSNQAGVFINGKAQVVEMLQFMTAEERERLLTSLRIKNPSLALELQEESLSFNHLSRMSDDDLSKLINNITAPVLGLALKGVDVNFQRRVLSLAPRDFAEQAYRVLTSNVSNEKQNSKRAQGKIISTLSSLIKRHQIKA